MGGGGGGRQEMNDSPDCRENGFNMPQSTSVQFAAGPERCFSQFNQNSLIVGSYSPERREVLLALFLWQVHVCLSV